MTVSAFLLFIAAGICCGLIEGLCKPLRHKLNLVFTVISDVVIALAFAMLHAIIIYFKCDGQIFFYAVCAQIIGFVFMRSVTVKLINKAAAKLAKNKKPSPLESPTPFNSPAKGRG